MTVTIEAAVGAILERRDPEVSLVAGPNAEFITPGAQAVVDGDVGCTVLRCYEDSALIMISTLRTVVQISRLQVVT